MEACSVIIPALNEEESIGSVVEDISCELSKAKVSFEIIVVDDGSTDQTATIARDKGARVIRHPQPGGYGLSLRDGILTAQHPHIAIIDGDGTYPVNRLAELLDSLKEYDMVIGARTGNHYKESPLKYTFRRILQLVCEFVAGISIPDVNSGLRVFKKERVLKFQNTFCLGFSFTTTITLAYHLNGYFVKYVPIEYYKRVKGRGHVRIIKDSLRTAQIVTQAILYYNPIKLFLLLSILSLTASLVCFILLAISPGFTWSLFSCMFFFSALILFAMGLMTEANRIKY